MLQGRSKTTAHHVTEHIENHHIGVLEQVVLFQELDGLPHHIAATAGARRRATRLHAHHAVVAFENKVFNAQFLGMKVN